MAPFKTVSEEEIKATVEAYFANGKSISSTARQLGLNRSSVQHRLDRARTLGMFEGRPMAGWTSPEAWVYPPLAFANIKNGSAVIVSDGHKWPGPPTLAHKAAVEVIRKVKPKLLIANGDMFDGARISRHAAHGFAWRPKVKEELDAVVDRMHELREAAQPGKTGCECYFNIGNHDMRFEAALAAMASEFEQVAGFRFADHFPQWEMQWALWINKDSDHPVMVKHRNANGVHAGYNNAMKSGVTIVTGHTHALEVKPYGDYRGRRWGVQTGTLSDLSGPQFEYTEQGPSVACEGFAVLTWRDGVLTPPELCEVINGRAWFRGEVVASK